jgi:3',5'-cyclic AMP phosphodiesterase CpdA
VSRRARTAALVALAAALAPSRAAAGAASFVRPPSLQSVTTRSAVVAFRLDRPCEASVRHGAGTELTRRANSAGPGTDHALALADLLPGTAYGYQVEACGFPLGEAGSFRTAPGPAVQEVHFAAMGDVGCGCPDQAANARTAAARRPDLVLTLGDNAYRSGTDEELTANFFVPMAPLLASTPVFPSLGNHEYYTADAQPYLAAFTLPANNPKRTERYYSFDWGFAHFVALDSTCEEGGARACERGEQLRWAEQDLRRSTARWKIVFFHHPPYSTGAHGSARFMRPYARLFERTGVDLVLGGHDHLYERTHPLKDDAPVPAGTPGAVTYVVAGHGGARLYSFGAPAAPFTAARDNTRKGFLDVTISGDRLRGTAYALDGTVIDQFTIRKVAPAR